jgi:hypothetical protein
VRTPSHARRTSPNSRSCWITFLAISLGIEKPMPIEPPEGEKIAVLTPITSPSVLNIGPPELPRLIEASVWMKSSYGPALISRERAETMPAVTVPPRPNGLPIASTQSPIRVSVLSPQLAAFRSWSVSTLSSARSVLSSRPTISADMVVSSWKRTVISSAPSMTWLLVTM